MIDRLIINNKIKNNLGVSNIELKKIILNECLFDVNTSINYTNINIMFVLFHEIIHFKQHKDIEDVNSSYYDKNILLLLSLYNQYRNKSLYDSKHESFYHEYDANIYAMKYLLEFINKTSMDIRFVNELNSNFADLILRSYGYEKYLSPVDFTELLANNNSDEIIKYLYKLLNIKYVYNKNNILSGVNMNDSEVVILKKIKNSRIKTNNLFNELK